MAESRVKVCVGKASPAMILDQITITDMYTKSSQFWGSEHLPENLGMSFYADSVKNQCY